MEVRGRQKNHRSFQVLPSVGQVSELLPARSSQCHSSTVSLCNCGCQWSWGPNQLAHTLPGFLMSGPWQSGVLGYSRCLGTLSVFPILTLQNSNKNRLDTIYRTHWANAADPCSSILTANRPFLNRGLCFIAFIVVTTLLGALNTAETILILYHIEKCYIPIQPHCWKPGVHQLNITDPLLLLLHSSIYALVSFF